MRPNRDAVGHQYGSHSFMIPARLAFHLDLRGPSAHVATACSSSLTALQTGVLCIQSGDCDAAIITGSTVHLSTNSHLDLGALNALAQDGRSKAFDHSADGFGRAEAAVAMVIQKEKDALRNYAGILSVRSLTDGFKNSGMMYPSRESQEILLRECYSKAGIDPAQVSYIEAHGTGTPSGDPEELHALHNVFCKVPGRANPLQVGSIKTNIGHTEGAAGLSGISKVIGAVQTGIIPPNLHFHKPNEDSEHLFDGSLKVVTEPTEFDRGIVGVSSFGIGGTNYHVVLQPGPVHESQPNQDLPILVPLSGRSELQVRHSLEEASEVASNPEFVHLVHKAYQRHIPGHSHRGIALIQPSQSTGVISVKWCETVNRPVWIVFPGMGSQHNEMGKALMKIDPFAESISRSRATLLNIGLNIEQLLSSGNQSIMTDVRHAFVAVTTCQMALWDTLKNCLAIHPDGFIGHSFGEFMCAYADGCLSAEETLLLADARGRAFKESKKIIGGMASIAMSAEDIKPRLPPNVELACFNAAQNVTVSGELESVTKLVEQMKLEGTMATMVNSCGFAAHSQYVQDAGDLLKKYVEDIGIGGRPRSSRWISTSIPESEWDSPTAKYCSADYFGGNVRNPVYFHQAAQHIPSGSLVMEVSPKGFFKALLSETVPSDCIHVAPMSLKAENKLDHFFKSVGEVYLSGVDVHMDKLYPQVPTPVSSSTPSLSHLVQWDHSKSWRTNILDYPLGHKYESIVNLDHLNHTYLAGHKIEDRIMLPATNILHNVWIQFAEMMGCNYEALPVQFTDVSFNRATILSESAETTLLYGVNTSTGAFEVENQGEIVASGKVAILPEGYQWPDIKEVGSSPYMPLNKDEVYKAFRVRGYNYTGAFQGIEKIDNEGRWADVKWGGNWTAFLDTVMQTSLLTSTTDHLVVPVDVQQITIDPVEFCRNLKQTSSEDPDNELVRVVNMSNKNIYTRGVEVRSLNTATMPRKLHPSNLVCESFGFCPLNEVSPRTVEYHFHELVDLVLENHPRRVPFKVVDIFTKEENSLASSFARIESLKPSKPSQLRMLTLSDQVKLMDEQAIEGHVIDAKETKEELLPDNTADLVLLDDPSLLAGVGAAMKAKSFVIVHSTQEDLDISDHFCLVSQKKLQGSTLSLLRKRCENPGDIVHISVDEDGFTWLADMQKAISDIAGTDDRVYVTSQGRPNSGILGLIRCLRMEDEEWNVRCIYDPEGKLLLDFDRPDCRLKGILQADLGLNAWKDDQLGTYRHIALEDDALAKKEIVPEAYVGTLTPRDLSSLSWIQLPAMNRDYEASSQSHLQGHKKQYRVVCSALNFRDVLLATGTVPLLPDYSYKGQYLGFEFSGFDEEGNRVMGFTNGNGLASFVHADPRLVWPVPNHWTLEEAATVPVVYATVLHAFHSRAHIQPGQTVLIHAGSGGVGQAAIRIALAHGCKVLTTVGSAEKREFIKKTFPEITDDHIGSSRDTSFEDQFMELTNHRGADIILNSLAGEKLQATLRCLGLGGKFLEIGVFDAYMNTKIGMRPFLKSVEIIGVDLLHIMDCQQGSDHVTELGKLMEDGIRSGSVSPLPTHLFSSDDLEGAFRFMANGKHRGKLVIKLKDDDVENKWNDPLNISAIKRSYFYPHKSYLIIGGLGGLGLELVSWLIERGARKLIITSRSGLRNGYQSYCMRKWLEAGADVQVSNVDLSDLSSAEGFISDLSRKNQLGGIFNAALVLDDKAFLKQTIESFNQVSRPKEAVTINLDRITRKHRIELDYFVCFSSIACGRGSFDQSNYGWSNSAVERICESRAKDGLHGLAIQYGVIGKVGFLSEMMKGKEMASDFQLLDVNSQSVESCLHVLDAAMQQDVPVVSSAVVAEKGRVKEERAGILSQFEKIFGIDNLKSVGEDKKLSELGMDSLIAVELRQALEREFQIVVTKENLRLLNVGHIIAIANGTFDVKTIGKAVGKASASEVSTRSRIHDKPLQMLSSHPSNRHIFIVHGSDGGSTIFKPLASRLKAGVYAFQFTGKPEGASVPGLAEFYIQKLKEIQPEGPYTIMGYSIGAAIAFAMAQQLKENGDVVENLVFLDGCPSYSAATTDTKRLFGLLALQSMNVLQDSTADQLRDLTARVNGNMEDGLKEAVNIVKAQNGLNMEENHVWMYMHLMISIGDYEPGSKYDGNVILLESVEPSSHSRVIPSEDYELGRYCSGKVTRHRVKGSHWTFFDEENLSDRTEIINSLME